MSKNKKEMPEDPEFKYIKKVDMDNEEQVAKFLEQKKRKIIAKKEAEVKAMEKVKKNETPLDLLNRNLRTAAILSAKINHKVENNVELTEEDEETLELTTKIAVMIAKNEREERKELDALSIEEMEAKLAELEAMEKVDEQN